MIWEEDMCYQVEGMEQKIQLPGKVNVNFKEAREWNSGENALEIRADFSHEIKMINTIF